MRKLLTSLALLMALFAPAATASAQQLVALQPKNDGATLDANSEAVTLQEVRGMATATIQVVGSFTGTLTPQCSLDGTTYVAFPVAPIGDPGATQSTITAADIYVGPIVGCRRIRVIASGWMAGAAVVEINTVQVSPGTSASANISLEGDITAGAQPANDPHFVECSNGSSASPCLITGTGTAGTAAPGVVTIQGIASGTVVPVSGTVTANLSATDNAVLDDIADGIAVTVSSGTITANLGATDNAVLDDIADGIAVTNAGTFVVQAEQSGVFAVRLQDGSGNAIASNANSGTRAVASVIYDGSGNLVTSFGGSGGTASAFGSAFPSGASSGTAAGFLDAGGNMASARVFDLDSGGGTQNVFGVNLRIAASGGSTEVAGGNGVASGAVRVTMASDSTGIVSLTTSSATIGVLAAGNNNIGDVDVATIAAGNNNIGDVDVATIAAGNNNIGDVDVASIAAGDNNIGNVDVVTLPSVTIGTFPDNEPFNIAQINGVTVLMGNGASGTGAQRVTLANDSTGVLANVATIGTSVTPGTSAAHLGKAEDAAHASGDTGVAMLARRSDTAASSSATDGEYVTLNTDSLGRLWVNPFPASPAAGTYLAVRPSNGSAFFEPLTPYTQDAALTVSTTTGPMTVGRASAAAPTNVSADNDAVIAWFLQNGSQVTNLAAGGTLITATSSSLNVACTTGCSGSATYAEDTVHASGDSASFVAGIRRDTTPSSSAGTAGDYAAINIDANGRLYVNAALYDAAGTALTADTQFQQDTALGTITSVTGGASFCRASQAAPSNVSADDDAALVWCLRNGSPVVNLAAGGTLITAGNGAASGALRVTLANDSTGILATVGTVTTVSTVTSLSQLAGNAINLGAGAVGTGTLRVVTATDDPVNDAAVKLDAQMVADDAATAGNPVYIGGLATASLVGQTPVAGADRIGFVGGLDRVQITRPHANLEDRVSGVVGVTDGSSTSLVASQGSGVRFCAVTFIVSNSSATNVTVDIRDGTGGSVIATIPAAADMGGAVIPLGVPLCTSAATAMAMDPSAAATTVTVTAIGFKTEL